MYLKFWATFRCNRQPICKGVGKMNKTSVEFVANGKLHTSHEAIPTILQETRFRRQVRKSITYESISIIYCLFCLQQMWYNSRKIVKLEFNLQCINVLCANCIATICSQNLIYYCEPGKHIIEVIIASAQPIFLRCVLLVLL